MHVTLAGSAGLDAMDLLTIEMNRIAAERPGLVVIDLSGLSFIASLAIGQLVTMRRAVVLHGGRVVLSGAREAIADVLRKANMDALFAMYESTGAALAAFAIDGADDAARRQSDQA